MAGRPIPLSRPKGKQRGLGNVCRSHKIIRGNVQLPVKLKGLDPAKQYKVEEINLYPGTEAVVKSQETYPGDFLMKVGINPNVDAGHSSVVLKIPEEGK